MNAKGLPLVLNSVREGFILKAGYSLIELVNVG